MLAAIGVILIVKQIAHAFGFDADFEGDESYQQAADGNTFSALGELTQQVQPGAVLIALAALSVMLQWSQPALKKLKAFPEPLLVVIVGIGMNALFGAYWPSLAIRATHMVQLPVAASPADWLTFFAVPDWSALTSLATWKLGVTIAIVASLELLLGLEATDKMDPYKRESDTNCELLAQGVSNTVAGLVGGLPLTGVVVRSAANIDAGARTRWPSVPHGVLLQVCVLAIPTLLNRIPLSALAALLLYT